MWLKSFSPAGDTLSTNTERWERISNTVGSDSPDKMTASRLDFHFNPQCVDRAGFCLFIKTYLEVEDFPSDFCQRLYRYFQHVEQGDSSTRGKWVYPAIMLQTAETHTVSTSLSFRRRLSSWCVLLLLSAGGWTAKRQARMCFFSPLSSLFCHVFDAFNRHFSAQTWSEEGPSEKDKSLPVFDLFLVTFNLYDKDGNGLLDSTVRFL